MPKTLSQTQKPSLANIDSTNCQQRIREIDKRLAELEEEKAKLLSRKSEIETGRLHRADEVSTLSASAMRIEEGFALMIGPLQMKNGKHALVKNTKNFYSLFCRRIKNPVRFHRVLKIVVYIGIKSPA